MSYLPGLFSIDIKSNLPLSYLGRCGGANTHRSPIQGQRGPTRLPGGLRGKTMPERNPTARPTIIAGTNLVSGTPNTGQLPYTLGGSHVSTVFSGVVGPDINICVGGGRLDMAFFHDSAMLALSGQAVTFYDSAVAVSGGPLAASGHKVVGVLAPTADTGISGAALRGGVLRGGGLVFTSGLCYSTRSGQAGFSAAYTPVISGLATGQA